MEKEQFISLSGVEINDDQFQAFQKFLRSFLDWNSKINVSAIKDEQGVWEKHFIDSVVGSKYIKIPGKKVLDLGTGGGFPLLPLSILYPDSSFTGLDSVGKKLKVVQTMAKESGIKIPEILHGRAEDFAQDKKYRERFDLLVTRAVAPWPTLLELTLPFIKIGGEFLAYQGPAIREDLETFKGLEEKLGAQISGIFEETVCGNERVFVKMKKVRNTPRIYPREVGMPKKKPLR